MNMDCCNRMAHAVLLLRTAPAPWRWCVGPVNPLLTKEGARGRLLTRHCKTSPDPSLVRRGTLTALFIGSVIMLCGCEGLAVHDTASLLIPRFQRSEVLGMVAGFGTTFAAVPDLIKMFKRRSSKGMNPTMAGIMGVFQIVWVYYGLLILSRPVIAWNMVAVVINFLSVGAYMRFARSERNQT
jgi:MtN3 and saliva related transmembrane protein